MEKRLCGTCKKPLTDARGNRKFHPGECQKIAHLKRCRIRSRKTWLRVSPFIDRICPVCKEPYQTRAARPSKSCRNPVCKNKIQRDRMKTEWDKMTPGERRSINKQKYAKYARYDREKSSKNYLASKIPKQVLKCKCPGCWVIHEHTFEPAYIGRGMPRIGCPRYPACVQGPAFQDGKRSGESKYSFTWGESWESGNGAMA